MGPWGALEAGLSKITGLSLGHVTQLVSLILIAAAWALGVRPSLVTLANMFLIGFFMDLFMKVLPPVSGWPLQVLACAAGLIAYSFGISFYLIASGGDSGPREGMMLGISRALGTSIQVAKIVLDLGALALAFVVGGPIGLGTLAFALGAGPAIQLFMRLRGYVAVQGELTKITDAAKGRSEADPLG
jgi:uncharacterized membrane protein YczE